MVMDVGCGHCRHHGGGTDEGKVFVLGGPGLRQAREEQALSWWVVPTTSPRRRAGPSTSEVNWALLSEELSRLNAVLPFYART